jgi:alkyl sulfatase BDS1-like metallo-beta-lactamase superfamily hydrolase
MKKALNDKLALSFEKMASSLYNLNGRGYLLESAYELKHGLAKPARVKFNEGLVAKIPIEAIFNILATRLIPEKAMDVHEAVHFFSPDKNKRFIVTIRKGIAEVVEGGPLPSRTPEPVAILTVDGLSFRRMATKLTSPAAILASGKIKMEGSWLAFLTWFGRFDRG